VFPNIEPMNVIQEEVRKFIIHTFLFGQGDGLTDDESLLEKGILDSTGVLELVSHLESTYDFKVADDELLPDNLDSVDAISAFVGRKRSQAS
jgi:acyl carrier protein